MKKFYFLVIILIISQRAFSQWVESNPFNSCYPEAAYFTDQNTGYVVGSPDLFFHGIIWKTVDGGDHWNILTSSTYSPFLTIHFVNSTTGFVGGQSGTIIKTTDAGTTWTALQTGTNVAIRSLFFTDVNTGYAVGNLSTSHYIFKTTNGGSTWVKQLEEVGPSFSSVCFIDPNVGYIAGTGILLKTTDGGQNWINQPGFSDYTLKSICFSSTATGYMVAGNNDGGYIFKTTDGGSSWILKKTVSAFLQSVCFPDANTGYTVGIETEYKNILKTTDAGENWFLQTDGVNSWLVNVFCSDANHGIILSRTGEIMLTTNGGGGPSGLDENKTFKNLEVFPNPVESVIHFNTPVSGGFQVFDPMGRRVLFLEIQAPTAAIDVSYLPGGLYFIKAENDNSFISGKFLKK